MDGIEMLTKSVIRVFTPETTSEKLAAVVDSVGILMSVLLFGLGWKEYVDGLLSTALLVLTCVSVGTSILFKVWKEHRDWQERKDAARSMAEQALRNQQKEIDHGKEEEQ